MTDVVVGLVVADAIWELKEEDKMLHIPDDRLLLVRITLSKAYAKIIVLLTGAVVRISTTPPVES
jgi:hypothetical protein